MKIFWMKSKSFLTLHKQQPTATFKAQKGSKDIVKTVHFPVAPASAASQYFIHLIIQKRQCHKIKLY